MERVLILMKRIIYFVLYFKRFAPIEGISFSSKKKKAMDNKIYRVSPQKVYTFE